jgi:hypothetical protein
MTVAAGLGLDGLIALRGLSRNEVLERFGLGEDDVVPGVGYGNLSGLERVDGGDAFPGHFFFRGRDQVLLYLGRGALGDADPAELERELGAPAERLRSRTGAESELRVHPDRGVAYATDRSSVEILEVFGPTTIEGYRRDFYEDPGEFIR